MNDDNFEIPRAVRLRPKQVRAVKKLIRQLPLIYNSESHFLRVAIIREIRRARQILESKPSA